MKTKVNKLIHRLGLKYKMRDQDIRDIVESQFEFSKEKMNEIDYTKINNEDDFNDLKKVFHYKHFGKIYINKKTLTKIIKIK